jgi:hypothetical protein
VNALAVSAVAAPAGLDGPRARRRAKQAGAAVAALATLGALACLRTARAPLARAGAVMPASFRRRPIGDAPDARVPAADGRAHSSAAAVRSLHGSAALLFASVLADSFIGHDRGSFENPGMLAPLVAASLGLRVEADALRRTSFPSHVRTGAAVLAGAVGVAGLGFHAVNVLRRPGGLSWLNAFYAAPLVAPAALALAGAQAGVAERLAGPQRARTAALGRTRASGAETVRIAGIPPGRLVCALAATGLAGTVGEVALLHARGSFQNPAMWLPVSLPPVAAVLTAKAAVERTAPARRPLTRTWLHVTAWLGVVGVAFHAYGIARSMGGWRNWRQNVVDGPPLPAPPSFSALAIAALAGLQLRDLDPA